MTCLYWYHLHLLYLSVLLALQLEMLDTSIVCKLNFQLSCMLLITSQIIFSMFSSLMSGIPSSAGPSPDTIKNLHLAYLSMCLNLTVHTYLIVWYQTNCMFFSITELFYVVCSAANIDF